jgi:hypothetical protein
MYGPSPTPWSLCSPKRILQSCRARRRIGDCGPANRLIGQLVNDLGGIIVSGVDDRVSISARPGWATPPDARGDERTVSRSRGERSSVRFRLVAQNPITGRSTNAQGSSGSARWRVIGVYTFLRKPLPRFVRSPSAVAPVPPNTSQHHQRLELQIGCAANASKHPSCLVRIEKVRRLHYIDGVRSSASPWHDSFDG